MSTSSNTSCNKLEYANTMKPAIYNLPEVAIEKMRKTIVYHIKEKLKQHSRHFVLRDGNWGTKFFSQHLNTSVLSFQPPSSPNDPDPLQDSYMIYVKELDSLLESDPLLKLQDQNHMTLVFMKIQTYKLKPTQLLLDEKEKISLDN
ncbi:hypothetical protein C1646_810043 [Rhizophagus diaphanus]|nr:hypothetical protein C1646_810043 [Rhizophagus diaphanus] [Rhizophagus sp. MUCL 43196]